MGVLYGRAGRLTTENGGFRPGQDMKKAVSHGSSKDPYGTYAAAKDVWRRGGNTAKALCALLAMDYACFDELALPDVCLDVLGSRDLDASLGVETGAIGVAGCGSDVMFKSTDFKGGDIVSRHASTPAECCPECINLPECTYWTFFQGVCYLKHKQATKMKATGGHISGQIAKRLEKG
jgi:hypothetical protein